MGLEVLPSDFGLPSMDIACLQFLACTKFCAAPIRVITRVSPYRTPTGEYPVFKDNQGAVITDLDKFVEYLRKNAQDVVLDGDLTVSEKNDLLAFSCLLKNRLYPALIYALWMDDVNFNTITNHWFASNFSFPYNMYYTQKKRKEAIAYLRSFYGGKLVSEVEIEFVTIKQALSAINLLATKLADKKYFYGDKPSSLDALMFGYLAPILKIPFANDRLQQHLRLHPNLVRFVESIISIYLPLTDDELNSQRKARDKWERRRQEAQNDQKKRRIREQERKTQESSAAKQSNEFHLRDSVLFGIVAITLSLMFAIHTGLITITAVEQGGDTKNELTTLPVGVDFQNVFNSE